MVSCNAQNQTKLDTNITPSYLKLKTSESSLIIKGENGFYCGFLDSYGNLWFGTNGDGLHHYNGKKFTHYLEKSGVNTNQIKSIIEDQEHNLWMGTGDGLWKYDRKEFCHIPIPFSDTSSIWLDKVYPVINPNAVHSLAQDKAGNIWLGTGGGGAYCYNGVDFTPYLTQIGTKQSDSLYHNWVTSITTDKNDHIWFASMTHGGTSRYDGKTFTQFMPKDGLSDDMIRTIHTDKSGRVWFGFNGNRKSGLTFYDGKSFHTFSKKEGLCNTNIMSIYEDKNGLFWLASGRGNLCVFNGKNFKEFQSKDGETFPQVLFILEDSNNHIWFGGMHGLWRYDGDSVINMAEQHQPKNN